MMKSLFLIICFSFSVFAFETSGEKSKMISKPQQLKFRKAGLKFNRAGRKYLEEKKKLKKGQEYEVTMKCVAGSRKKCNVVKLDDLK